MLQQLPLFDLPTAEPAQPRPARPVTVHRSAATKRRPLQQLALLFRPRHEAADPEDSDWDYPEHTRIRATDAPAPKVRAPASVFDLALCPVRVRMAQTSPDTGSSTRIVREPNGLVRVTRVAIQETDEWRERERIRRAKQKPPKPSKAAKTKGEKLMAMIGGDDGQ